MGTVGAGFRYIGHGVLLLADRNRQHNLFPSGHFVSAGFSLQYDCGITVAKDRLAVRVRAVQPEENSGRLVAGQGRGEYHLFLADMKNSEYLRIISDALRIVHSVAVSLPRDYTFQVTDYGF